MSMWDKQLEKYDKLVEGCERFDRKGKTVPYTSANGYMFSLLNKEGQFGIRLSKDSQKKFNETHGTGPFMSHGATMRDYVHIPDQLMDDQELMRALLNESFDFAKSLPPKPTKK
jgi:TfoX/Sxy family transcriptional regulator of competence genes